MEDKKKTFKKKKWHAPFLEALSKFGTVSTACTLSSISRTTYYKEIGEHPEFKFQCVNAEHVHRDLLLLKITNLAMREGSPSQTSLQALQFLINRADRRLQEQDRAGQPTIPQDGDDTITITVTESLARRMFPVMREFHLADQNGSLDDESDPRTAKKKPN